MAKRARGSRSAHRPGGQGPNRSRKTSDEATSAAKDASPTMPANDLLTDDDYSDVEIDEIAAAAITAATAPAEPSEPEPRRRRERRRARQRPSDLAARASAEDVWVRDDLRRIGVVSVILLVSLAACWVVFGFLDVLNLY